MKIITHGTRGSIPVSGEQFVRYGGNTTCIEIQSACLPPHHWLVVDGGSGYVPFSQKVFRATDSADFAKTKVHALLTHFHYDHIIGILLAILTFIKMIKIHLYGPIDHAIGPKKMMEDVMRPPYFPVHFLEQSDHFDFTDFEYLNTNVVVFHPRGGSAVFTVANLEQFEREGGHVPVGDGKYPLDECLVVKTLKSNHPDQTISYRFEERPTDKVCVILTDHENQSAISGDMKRHLKDVDLLIIDGQYDKTRYFTRTAGFGHGTGEYCATLAWHCEVKKVGLTHHDPSSTDEQVDAILKEARAKVTDLRSGYTGQQGLLEENVFACADYQEIEV